MQAAAMSDSCCNTTSISTTSFPPGPCDETPSQNRVTGPVHARGRGLRSAGHGVRARFPQALRPRRRRDHQQRTERGEDLVQQRSQPLFDKMVVKNAAGKVVSRGEAKVDPDDRSLLEVGLAPLPPGTYHVYWHVTSKDGHRTEGDFSFTVSGH